MDMHKKRELRAKKKQEGENKESQTSVNINWYPGHMAKTRRQIEEDLKIIDVVIELLDARIPVSSRNPILNEIVKGKKKIVVLNKCDMADEKQNRLWVEYYEKQGIPAVLTDANSGKGIDSCAKKIEEVMKELIDQQAEKGRVGRKIRAMILGIPNVGKSSFINRIAKKNSLQVGNKPGVTRAKQWIRINEKIELLDTPGVLWPKLGSEEVGLKLAYTGTIKAEIIENVEVAYKLVQFLMTNYKKNYIIRYKLDEERIEEILNRDLPENENIYEVMLETGKVRGCLMSGGKVDEEKISRIILDEFKNGKIGKITLERRD